MKSQRLKHRILMLYSGLVRLVLSPGLDEIPFLRALRGRLYALGMPKCGPNFQVSSNAILWGLEHLHVGSDVYIAPGVTLICLDQLTLGDRVLISPNVVITNGNHVFKDGGYAVSENVVKPVSIGDGSWIGSNSTIVAGVKIGKGVLVAANAAVIRDVPDYDVVGGVPARSLKRPVSEGA